jgi:hypothetical protein
VPTEQFHKLILALIVRNIQERYANGLHLARDALIKLTRITTGIPEAIGLPNGAGQMAAQIVWKLFIRYTCFDRQPKYNPALVDHPASYNMYVTDLEAKRGKLRLPHIGWVNYLAPAGIKGMLESQGTHLKGAYLRNYGKRWHAEINFEREDYKQIGEDVAMAKALARGDFTDDDEHDRDLCLLAAALDLTVERDLRFDQHLPTLLIMQRFADNDLVKVDKDIISKSFPRLGMSPAARRAYKGLRRANDKLTECPASYSVEELWKANTRVNNSEMIAVDESQ